jgi:tRNA A37 N6-isopentenylltransferase MiaA
MTKKTTLSAKQYEKRQMRFIKAIEEMDLLELSVAQRNLAEHINNVVHYMVVRTKQSEQEVEPQSERSEA